MPVPSYHPMSEGTKFWLKVLIVIAIGLAISIIVGAP